MNPLRLIRRMLRLGRVTDPAPSAPETLDGPDFGGSVQFRHVDAGSCNGCEIELGAAFGPVYDAERFGARLVASPRHADAVIVTGPVTHNMAEPLRRTVAAVPRPRLVLAVGDCAIDCGRFRAGYGVAGSVGEIVDVDAEVPGCPPEPEVILQKLRQVTRR